MHTCIHTYMRAYFLTYRATSADAASMLQTDAQVECRPWPPPSGWYLPLSRGVKVSLRSGVRKPDGRGRRGLSHQPYKYCSFEGLSLGSDRLGKPGPPRTSTGETGPTKRYPHITRKMEPEGSTGGSWGRTADGCGPIDNDPSPSLGRGVPLQLYVEREILTVSEDSAQ